MQTQMQSHLQQNQPQQNQPQQNQPQQNQPPQNQKNRLNSFQQIAKERLEYAVEIYYETSVHKKFLADVYAVIPKGRKCVIWFTNRQCWLFQIAKRPYTPGAPGTQRDAVVYDDVRMIHMPLTNDAWYAGQGTIIYGTCISEKRNDVQRRFSVENVHCLCGEKQPDSGTLGRFTAFFDAHSKESSSGSGHQFKLCMPIMHTKYDDAVRDAMSIATYDVFCIQHRFLNRTCTEYKNLFMNLVVSSASAVKPPPPCFANGTLSFFPKQANATNAQPQPQPQPQPMQSTQSSMQSSTQSSMQRPPLHLNTRTFVIRPDVQNDIYYVLRSPDEPITPNTMIAHIPNYKTSVMMNSLFRNIKENRNLDALEESDDEDEALIPLVDLNKWVRMSCAFISRFQRWKPVALH
jgi:hypothetical protein